MPQTGADSVDLTVCDREPIHIPGSIQPHGLLLVADAGNGRVVAGAGDIEGRLTPVWLGRPLSELVAQDLGRVRMQLDGAIGTVMPLAAVPGRREAFDAIIHRSEAHLLVELEPKPETAMTAATLLGRLDAISAAFERATDLQSLCERAAVAFREMTGFDRVMIYRFLDDGAGMVIAEDRDRTLASFLHHHFPASDIPRQARALYVRNRVRVIPDVTYEPAPLRPEGMGLGMLDFSDAALRSVSPIHLQYLRNMGVAASASVSIVRNGALWGLVACHNHSPLRIAHEQRVACAALAGSLARQIRAKEDGETYRERIRLRACEDAVIGRFADDISVDRAIEETAEDLRRMFDADGFAIVQGNRRTQTGTCPPEHLLPALAAGIAPRATVEPFATFHLARDFPAAEEYREAASGLLAMAIAAEPPALLLWFRAEQLETVNWAGNPHKDAPGEGGQLTPRSSFEAWKEMVHGRARRWTRGELDAAVRLRRTLYELRQSRRLRELNRELSATIAEKDALIVEKEHLLREVNHRVQNSLQLVQAFLALQERAEPDERLQVHLAEAQRRLSAVALVHRRLYQAEQVDTTDLGRYLEDLVRDMLTSMGPEWQDQISLDLAPMLIQADRAVNVGLILTELVINANKYAYGGGSGPIEILLEQHRGTFRLEVADSGQAPPQLRTGFGTRMIAAMVQTLGGTVERADNLPGMRVIITAPVEAR
ncbi:GAF domain-containing protein [Sphingomonas nostoxanthinifaciens]|nr:GAF domain-containing protein [Sphingomonas nostoxanthinifaciens]